LIYLPKLYLPKLQRRQVKIKIKLLYLKKKSAFAGKKNPPSPERKFSFAGKKICLRRKENPHSPERKIRVRRKEKSAFAKATADKVELQGIEPWSKHIRRKLSTCLFMY